MKFSVCIPNYNYAGYIGRTITSILEQEHDDFEVLIADNASTDNSVAIVKRFDDPRIQLRINNWNVGFAENLVRAAAGASGDFMIMLSSDDIMGPEALRTYRFLIDALGRKGPQTVLSSIVDVIDSNGNQTSTSEIDWKQWAAAKQDEHLSEIAGGPVYVMPAAEMLERALRLLRTPFRFATTCYPRALYDKVEGYSGNQIINPDKWFSWKLLYAADQVLILDRPLFRYRVHSANQGAQQRQSGALKHLCDQYQVTFYLPESMLQKAGLTRRDLAKAFIEQDIALRGLLSLGNGDRLLAKRTLRFGAATYPDLINQNSMIWILRALLLLGPIGRYLAQMSKDHQILRWNRTQIRYQTQLAARQNIAPQRRIT